MSRGIYQFGRFRLDPLKRLLLRDGEPVTVTPKVFDTLLYLVANPGRLIGKPELMARVWPDTFVEEVTIARAISDLRKALGEGANGEKLIETVPKHGYRFVAQVTEAAADGGTRRTAPRRWLVALALLAVGALAAAGWAIWRRSAGPSIGVKISNSSKVGRSTVFGASAFSGSFAGAPCFSRY